jgi:hypothetical protein
VVHARRRGGVRGHLRRRAHAHLRRAPNLFHFLLAAGCLLLMCLQSIINLGVVTGVLPTKGMSLPFISAGLSNLLLMGLLVGILINTQRTWGRAALPPGRRLDARGAGMSRFLISCGGTGGHVSPGISLAEGLVARGHEATLLISMKKVDARLVEKYPHLRFERMPGRGFSWHPAGWHAFRRLAGGGPRYCLRLMRATRPDVVVGFRRLHLGAGGPGGAHARVPVALHEANRVPGLAIRALGRFAARVYLPLGIRVAGVRAAATRHAGLSGPQRDCPDMPAAAARQALGLDPKQKVLAILGGSQGASVAQRLGARASLRRWRPRASRWSA